MITWEPREMDIRHMRLEELFDKMNSGNYELSSEENEEIDKICDELGLNAWAPRP